MDNFDIDEELINRLFHIYSSTNLIEIRRNQVGSANEVYNIRDSMGARFVMRILRAQNPSTVNLEAAMQSKLNSCGVTTPQYIRFNDGNYFAEVEGLKFTLSRHIDGDMPSELTTGLITDFGAMIARIHDCLDGFVIPNNEMQWFDPRISSKYLPLIQGSARLTVGKLVGLGESLLKLNLPRATIHGDFWLGNIFAEGDRVTAVFDFETAQNTVRIIDLARAYTSARRESNLSSPEIIALLEKGYSSEASIPINQVEKNSFGLAIAYVAGVVAAWHLENSTGRETPYIEMGEEALLGY